jgi:hydroxypyruvate isomerase
MAASEWKLRFAPHLGIISPEQPLFRHSVGSTDPLDHIRFAADMGFAGIEDNLLTVRPPEVQARMGEELARRGLEMGCFVNNLAHWREPWLTSDDPDVIEQLVRGTRAGIEAGKRAGGRYLTTICARDLSLTLDQALARMTDNLKRLGEIALKEGVLICLEQTSEPRDFDMVPRHIADALKVVQAVDCPAVMLCLDLFHVQAMDGDLINTLDRCWDRIAVIQAGDNPGRLEPGSGEVNFVNLFRHLTRRGWSGLVELEHNLTEPGLAGEQKALEQLRRINAAV